MRGFHKSYVRVMREESTKMKGLSFFLIIICLALQGVNAEDERLTTIGWIEKVRLLPEGFDVIAKIDTGADNSSLDVLDWVNFSRNNKQWIRFNIRNNKEKTVTLERPLERYTRIKRKQSEPIKRPVVLMKLCIDDVSAITKVNLAKRGNFKYRMLIGRSFLKGQFLVNAAKKLTIEPKCP